MAGLIKREDVELVRERTRIEEIAGAYVTLKSAGVGSMKGLCPFHDERSPSFHVRPQVGLWHCFGCGEGGDVIDFVQRIDHLGFAEAVEFLAGRAGIQLRYEDGGTPRRQEEPGRRQRLVEMNRLAAEYFVDQLMTSEANPARAFLAERGFGRDAAADFGVGYAPRGWENLLKFLRGKNFTEPELQISGLTSQGNRGIYDRFRGRLMWPIRDLTAEVVGFGARRIHEDDQGPKYLNTPETALYKKSQVLYGIDLAKREIAKNRQIVIVEGYTDVMAAHLAGVRTAVATCGTAFGSDHVRVVRRLLGDTSVGAGVRLSSGVTIGGEVIFTFDGDEAGRKAALRAFDEDQRFFAQTFVAVDSLGLDPCDLRQQYGDSAVRELIAGRIPLFEFAVKSTLAQVDLNTAEGRVLGLRASAPVVAQIRDAALRPEYARLLAGWIGMDVETVRRAVASAQHSSGQPHRSRNPGPSSISRPDDAGGKAERLVIDRNDPISNLERQSLEVVIQVPHLVAADNYDQLDADVYTVPAYRAVHDAIRAAGGVASAQAEAAANSGAVGRWIEKVRESAALPVAGLITELAVAPLPADRQDALRGYAAGIVVSLIDTAMGRKVGELRGRLQRADPADPEYQELFTRLVATEEHRQKLRSIENLS